MTTRDLINTLSEGKPITGRLVKEILTTLKDCEHNREALKSERNAYLYLLSKHNMREDYLKDKVVFTKEEVGWIDDEIRRLKEEVETLTSRRY